MLKQQIGILLKDSGRKKFVEEYNKKLLTTINHKEMKSNIFYCIDAVKKGRNI